MQLYYKAKVTAKDVGAELPTHIVQLGWASEDGYDLYTHVDAGFDPATADALAHAWTHGQHGIIMTCLEAKDR